MQMVVPWKITMPDNQIPEISLTPDSPAHEILMRRLKDMYESARIYHGSQWDEKHDLYTRLYLAKPRHDIKTKPFLGASNLFMPLSRVILHSIMYREDDAFFNQDPPITVRSIGKPRVPITEARLQSVEQLDLYYQSYYRYIAKLRDVTKVALKENGIDGTAVLHPRWSRDYIVQRVRDVDWKAETETVSETILGQQVQSQTTSYDPFWQEKGYLKRAEIALIENTNLSNLYVAPGSGPSLQWPICPWYLIINQLDWQQCLFRKRNGYDGVDDELKATLGTINRDPRERTTEQEAGLPTSEGAPTTELVEFYMRLPLPGDFEDWNGKTISQNWKDIEDGWEEEIIVSVWWKTKTIARIRPMARVLPPNPAGLILRPHVDLRYQTIPRFFYGMGIMQMMLHMNKALNQYMNQGVDYGTLNNVPFYWYEPSVGLMPDIIGVQPGQGIPVSNASGVKVPPTRGDPAAFFASQMNIVQSWAERDSGVNDFNLGRGASTPNAPQTARMGLAMLNESNLAFTGLASEHASQLEDTFEIIHLLHQRNAPESIDFRMPGDTPQKALQMSSIPGAAFRQDVEVRFQINPNRAAEQQNAQAMAQFFLAIPYIAQIPRAVRALGKNLWEKSGTPGTKPPFSEIWPEEIYQLQEIVAEAQLRGQVAQIQAQQMQAQGGPGQAPGPPQAGGQPQGAVVPFPGAANMPMPPQPEEGSEDVAV